MAAVPAGPSRYVRRVGAMPQAALNTPYVAAAASYRTHVEHTRTSAAQPRERRRVIAPGRGLTLQRPDPNPAGLVAGTINNPAYQAQKAARPSHRIPFAWWNTFLPHAAIDRIHTDAAGNPTGVNVIRNKNSGAHMAALEALGPDIAAPTKTDLRDQHGNRHEIVANARPLLLYKRKTADEPAASKHCKYGKIRDDSTNSWRCIKNPNHHMDSNMT